MRYTAWIVPLLLLLLCFGLPLESVRAQSPVASSVTPTPDQLRSAARLHPDHRLALDFEHPDVGDYVHSRRPSRRQGETLMIVGGAGILVGLLADEALITIAGAAVGGYGLYVYLQASPKKRR
jgi:hypothetical protein